MTAKSLTSLDFEGVFHTFVPAFPQIRVNLSVGDDPKSISHLLFVEFAERSGMIHAAVHFIGFGRAGRSAEVSDGAPPARLYVLDLAAGHDAELFRFEHLGDIVSKYVSGPEVIQAYEFTARKHVAVGGQRKEAPPASAR